MTHICVSKLTIIGADNGLSPGRRQAIIWTNAGILLIGPLGTNFSEISIEILTFSFKKMRLKVSFAKRRPFCLGLNVLRLLFCYKAGVDGKCTNSAIHLLYPPLQLSWKGGILVSPCPSVRPSVCSSVDRIVSALYLQQYLPDPFHIGTSYPATSEGVSCAKFVSKLKNLKYWQII